MNFLNKTIEYGLYLLVFLLPIETRWIIKPGILNNGPWEYGTYSLYATDLLLIFVLFWFIIYWVLKRRIMNHPHLSGFQGASEIQITDLIQNKKYKILNLLMFGLIIISAISVFFAADKLLALYKFGWLILGLGLFWLAASANYSRTKLIYAMLAGALLQAGLGIWQFLDQATFASKWLGLALHRGADLGTSVIETAGEIGSGERWLRAYGGLDHPNIFGGLLAIGIILVINQIISYEKNFGITNYPASPGIRWTSGLRIEDKIRKVKFIVFYFLLIVLTAALFFSFSRSAWLALAAGLTAMVILAVAGRNLKSQKGLAEIILALGILFFILFSQYQNLVVARLGGEGRLEIKSNSERLASDQASWRLIKNNWLIGVGPGNYTLAARDKIFPGQASYDYQPAHNVFLLVWSEVGIFGLVFFCGIIVCLIIFNFPLYAYAPEEKQFSPLRLRSGGQAIFKQFSISKFLKPTLSTLKIWENVQAENLMINAAVLIALIILMTFDHWLWSLHFGVLFFWLALGLAKKKVDNFS